MNEVWGFVGRDATLSDWKKCFSVTQGSFLFHLDLLTEP